jgi:hypothetical protein
MEGDSIEGCVFRPSSLKMGIITNCKVSNVFGHLFFILLVDKNKFVMFGVGAVIQHPLSSWMISFILLTVR